MLNSVDRFILDSIKDKTVSGHWLSQTLNISRTAVWKRIKKLESLGYVIEKTHKGYRLKKNTDLLLFEEVEPYLKTNRLGKNYIFFQEVDSTNSYAKKHNLSDGTVIVAENQTAGRGRKGRYWMSIYKKGLYFTLVLKEKISVNHIPVFSFVFPVSVKNVITKLLNLEVKIKWPNDLYINNKKVAGFLLETELEGSELLRLIVGIGINVNQKEEEFNDELTATSLFIETGKPVDRKKLLGFILSEIEKNINNFDRDRILEEVNNSLLWKGERIKILDEGVEGILIGVTPTGGIRILTDNKILEFYSGDLSLRRES